MKMPDEVLCSWQAYFAVEPWPEERADLRSALQSAHMHHSMTGEKISIDKFLPDWNANATPVEEKQDQDLDQAITAWVKLSERE
jgi:hypothetical protein